MARNFKNNPMITSRKLRVAMVAQSFPLQEGRVNGGTQGVTLYLSQALAEIPDIDLHVIVPLAPPGTSEFKKIYGLQIHILERKKAETRIVSFVDLREMFRLIEELSADIVHFHGLPRWANQCRLPNVVTIHGISERDVLYRGSFLTSRIKYLLLRFIEGTARRKSRNVIVINPYVYKFLGSQRNQRVWDIPNPVSKEFFTISRHPIEGRIFSASHITPLKNIHSLIRAFSQIASNDSRVELILAGSHLDSDYGRECRSLVNTLGLTERIKFLGLLSLERIREELSQAACFTLCSLQETAPLSISEAMAAGLPVVASRVGGIPWMVEDGLTGILVDAMDIEDIARGLKRVLFSNVSIQMGIMAKQKAKAFYPPEVAKKTLDVYKEILNNIVIY
jgi:glycosyltransferase involved in cell wall biosynthesis